MALGKKVISTNTKLKVGKRKICENSAEVEEIGSEEEEKGERVKMLEVVWSHGRRVPQISRLLAMRECVIKDS